MDVGATFAELASGRPVEGSLARSVLPVLRDPSQAHREVALSELRREAMVATAEWKLAVNRDGQIYMLYDLVGDPSETSNLAGLPEHEDVAGDLLRALRSRQTAGRPSPSRHSRWRRAGRVLRRRLGAIRGAVRR
jgi:hypothetical protein